MSDKAYQQRLPKKRMAAGALFFDAAGRLLAVEPTYKPNWEIPGGAVELNESPRAACLREVKEELGLARPLRRLLCLDYLHESADKTEALVFIFLGGILSAAEIQSIHLPADELHSFAFVDVGEMDGRFNPRLTKRVQMAVEARETGRTFYLEDQERLG